MVSRLKKKILLIEDEHITAARYTALLEKNGFEIVPAMSGDEGVRIASGRTDIDLILADIELGEGIDGTAAVKKILSGKPIPAVFISSYSSSEIINKTEAISSYGFVFKNSGDAILIASVNIALRLFEAEMNLHLQKEELEATNEEMQAALEQLEEVNHGLFETQNNLLKSESELKSLFNALLVGVGMIVDSRFTKVNSYLCNLLGYEEHELTGSPARIIFSDDEEYERVSHELYGMMRREGQGITNASIRHKGGYIIDGFISLSPVNPDNPDSGVCATLNDITELNRAERALRESEIRFKSVMEQSTLPMIILDQKGLMIDANEAWGRLWNVDKNQYIGVYNILEDPQNINIRENLDKAYQGEPSDMTEHVYDPSLSGNTGIVRWITGRVYPLKDQDGIVQNVVILLEDVTDRKIAEEALKLSEENFRNIYETINIGFFRTGLDGRIFDLNPASLRIFDFSSTDEARAALNDTTEPVYYEHSEWERVRRVMNSGTGEFKGVVRLRKKGGAEFRGSLDMKIIKTSEGIPLYIEGLIEDVTEREKTQEMLIQTEKMITVAGLAAGMAHEINNPLGIIMQNSENALHRMLDDLPGNIDAARSLGTEFHVIKEYAKVRRIDQYLNAVRDAGSRAARIVSSMLKFSRGTESTFDYLNINMIIDKALDLASNDYDIRQNYDFRNIRIIRNYGVLPDVPCTETQIEQVFLNIFKNSAQAMRGTSLQPQSEQTISITTSEHNGYVRIEIRDNGPGMDESVRKRIFEPFFTSGNLQGGIGLGLSVSYYIVVTGHGGSISVESAPGEGTAFIITLPVQRKVK